MPKDSRAKRERMRDAKRRARAAESDEARNARLARNRQRCARKREEETPAQRAERLADNAARTAYIRARRARELQRLMCTREEETPAQRAERLAKEHPYAKFVSDSHLRSFTDGVVNMPDGRLCFGFMATPGGDATALRLEISHLGDTPRTADAVFLPAPGNITSRRTIEQEIKMEPDSNVEICPNPVVRKLSIQLTDCSLWLGAQDCISLGDLPELCILKTKGLPQQTAHSERAL